MTGILATQSSAFIIGPIAWILGKLMNGIYVVLDAVGINNIGVSIILFTIIVYTLQLPLTIKQQKFSKMSAVMNPEIQKLQKKYQGKKDQASMLKQQEEMQAIYEKYGTSPTGGCSSIIIQFPLIMGLYAVIQKIPAYVDGIKAAYMPLVNSIMSNDAAVKVMEKLGTDKPIFMDPAKFDYSQANTLVDVLYKFQDSTWTSLAEKVPSLTEQIHSTTTSLTHLNSFLGINIAETPMNLFTTAIKGGFSFAVILAIAIPIIAGITQWLNVKLMPQAAQSGDNNAMASSMKMMNMTMPIFSMVMCFTFPSGIGLYWIASSVVRSVQQVIINKSLNKKSIDIMIEENQKKMAKKRAKKGVNAKSLNDMAQRKVRNLEEPKKNPQTTVSTAENEEKLKSAQEKARNAKPGSLASKANMVKDFNESNRN